jgi:nitroimidazol reductase NimA-like FMN-containing flavoprotein (pyridoxamine 5'-phosphate oxidase superfamily)
VGAPARKNAGMAPTHSVPGKTISRDGGAPRGWDEALAALERAFTFWLATIDGDGKPHLVPVLAVVVEGRVYVAAGAGTRKARNLARDPRCALATEAEGLDVTIEGRARPTHEEAILRAVADAYASKYEWRVTVRDGAFHDAEGAPTAGPPPYDVYELQPATGYGFGTVEPARSTRWRF